MSMLQHDFASMKSEPVDHQLILRCKYFPDMVNVQEALAQYKWCLENDADELNHFDKGILFDFLKTVYLEEDVKKLEV